MKHQKEELSKFNESLEESMKSSTFRYEKLREKLQKSEFKELQVRNALKEASEAVQLSQSKERPMDNEEMKQKLEKKVRELNEKIKSLKTAEE